MARGRKRKFNPAIPKHIDQNALPKGAYFEDGRWYRFEPCQEGGPDKKRTIAPATVLLSELHALMEAASGSTTRGTVAFVFDRFLASREFRRLKPNSQKDYRWADEQVRTFPTRLRVPLGQLMVDRLTVPVFQLMVDQVAEATPAKANHMLRYARRAFTYGVQRGHCRTNPAKGTKAAEELGEFKMPDHDVFAAVHAFARQRGALKAHTRGSLSPYLAPAMVLAYGCRLRGLEVNTLTDAHGLREGILCNRLKGSKDNITEWDTDLRAAWAELVIQRAAVWSRRKFPTPLKPEQRFLMVSQTGDPLDKSSLDTAWRRLMDAAVAAKVITDAQRFTLHGLKHRGITDSEDKSAAGHKTKEMQDRYDHELRVVAPAAKRKQLT